jgi:formyltetrahydrofolate deformylase
MTQNHILLIDCPDQKGIIHVVTGALLDFGGNIISNREFVEVAEDSEAKEANEAKPKSAHFFMRTEFEADLTGERRQELLKKMRAVLPKEAQVSMPESGKKRVVVLATTEHHCLAELLVQNAYDKLNIEVVAVVSNHEQLRELTEKFQLPFHLISHEGQSREEHEVAVLEQVKKYQPDFLILAKYMRILSGEFVAEFPGRIINIHHSFLPAFVGANPYRQAYRRGVKIIGATAHWVTEKLDEGPIITQDITRVNHSFDVAKLRQAGQEVEKSVLVRAVRLVSEDRVFVKGNKTVIFK